MSSSRDDLAQALLDGVLGGARHRDPACAKQLLEWMCEAIDRGEPLRSDWAKFLTDALRKAVANPKRAGAALGLIAPRKRPASASKLDRDFELVMDIFVLRRSGIPLKDSRKGLGCFSQVAENRNVSYRIVDRAWSAFLRLQLRIRGQ